MSTDNNKRIPKVKVTINPDHPFVNYLGRDIVEETPKKIIYKKDDDSKEV